MYINIGFTCLPHDAKQDIKRSKQIASSRKGRHKTISWKYFYKLYCILEENRCKPFFWLLEENMFKHFHCLIEENMFKPFHWVLDENNLNILQVEQSLEQIYYYKKFWHVTKTQLTERKTKLYNQTL